MPYDADILTLPLATIAERCQRESVRFFRHDPDDPRYCYEMFRRAIVQQLGQAWSLIYAQYTPLVASWVEGHANFTASGEDATYFVNRAFEKMWSALSPEKFANFADLKSLLRYLKLCTYSVIIDHARMLEQARFVSLPPLDQQAYDLPDESDPGVETMLLAELDRQQFWNRIQQRLKGEEELRVLYYRFVLDLMPREICARFPQEFPDVKAVYKMLQKVLDRLGRDPELKNFLGKDD
ncbi:MAG: hypothetical protein U0350_19585 [Caldilineaceae bacterium]